jgi:hypothetical protein
LSAFAEEGGVFQRFLALAAAFDQRLWKTGVCFIILGSLVRCVALRFRVSSFYFKF